MIMTKWTLQQQLAIELDNRNIIVSAGAGSGKTAVLTERVINKIRNGVKINQLLILTFTRAAALEMKERIRKALVKEGYSEQLLLIDSSYITTFDSFALAIVKRYHYLLDISKNIEITPSCIIDIQKRKIIDEIFDNIYKNKNQEDLKIIYDFCFKDDNGLKNSIYEISSKMDQLVNKKEYLEHYFDNYLTIINSQINYFDKVVKDKLNNILVLLYELSGFCEGDVLSSVLDVKESLSYYTSIFELKEKLKFELPRKNKECSDGYSELKATIKKYCDELIKELFYNSKEEMLEEVNKTIPLQRFIIKIINELEEKINKYKKENSLFTFYDIAKKAIEVVELNNDVQLELMDEYNEIMIDEYQDTSDIQEKFISLISKNNVYMVGDMKQSIYGFRNANPDLFKSKYNSYKEATIDSINTKIDLLHNFRSRKNVVDCINGIFGKVMDYTFGGVDYLKGHIMNQGNHKFSLPWVFFYPKVFPSALHLSS